MKFILGTKLNMTQIFDKDGIVHPATAILATPNTITQVKNTDSDGYTAIQIGSGTRNVSRIHKAQKGAWKDLGTFTALKEFRIGDTTAFKAGDKVELGQFKEGDVVEVSGISKGKGFQGVVKRHGFHGGPRTHGQKHSEREPGSIGGGLRNKVPKKMRMAGRMGGDRITVKNLKVVHIDPSTNTLYIEGAVPGRRGTLLEISGK
ncbi:MAG: 50S ribosomal protein L3 [Patescibacteria group bacterium]|nr:50S ribosomal protein L3 [Patescibacteria group bacterium]